MKQTELAAAAEDRSRFFWWLAEWFLRPPSQDQLNSLPGAEMVAADAPDEAMSSAWRALATATPDPEALALDELGAEFTRLLGGVHEGSGPPPPFESVWREDRLIGESTIAVIQAYHHAGFADIDPEAGPQDHLSVELKFIALLALREAEAWRAHDAIGARTRVAEQHEFVSQHLAIWAPRWAESIIEQSRLPLFAALARLLKAGLAQWTTDSLETTA